MKYVYVLVSSPDDLYYEQAVMSVYSLRRHMPDADIEVLVDNKTYESFHGNRIVEYKGILEPSDSITHIKQEIHL